VSGAIPEEVTVEALVADLLAAEIAARAGAVGVLVQDVSHLDRDLVLPKLAALEAQGQQLRVAYLAGTDTEGASEGSFAPDKLTAEVEQAERWRNERGLDATIVVIASGEEARLSSLHDFDLIGPRQLKERLVRRAIAEFGETNDVQGRWWELLRADPRVSFRQLLDYYSALASLEPSEATTRASRELHRLGLLPDPALFDNPREAAVRRRLELNRELVVRLQTLTEKDRKVIAANIATEHDAAARNELNRALRLLREARRGARGLEDLTLSAAQDLFGARARARHGSEEDDGGSENRTSTRGLTALAADVLAMPTAEQGADLDEALEELVGQLNRLEEPSVRRERLATELPSGMTVQGQARTEIVNLMGRLIGEDTYGAWVVVDGEDIEEMLRRFHGEQDIRARFTRAEIDEYLRNFDHDEAHAIAQLFDEYNELRQPVLRYVRMLCAEPLAVAAASESRAVLLNYIAGYQRLFDRLSAAYEPLFAEYGAEVDGLLARFLSLELIVFGAGAEGVSALLAPTHPLFLWHYAEYCRIVDEQRSALSERDRRLVAEAARELPNFLTSICIPPIAADQTVTLPNVSRIGPLPYFGPSGDRATGDDGFNSVRGLIEAFPSIYPPAKAGLRLTLLDPPDAGIYLSLLTALAESGALEGAHLTVLRHPREKVGTELRLAPDDEDRVAAIFRSTAPERRFTFEVVPVTAGELSPDGLASHLLVLFDQSPRRQDRIHVVEHPIQPLAMTQRLQYRAQAKTVDLVPAPGGIFASYFGVAERLTRTAPASYFAVHQVEELRRALSAVAESTEWTVVADRRVDRDLSLGELRIGTAQEGERDVAVFARSSDPFRRAIRDVARQYNTAITVEQLDELLRELSDLLDAGVLTLRPNGEGRINHAHVKGLLGTLIAARWYRNGANDGRERLLLSLDDAIARRWLHLRDDALRADLLAIEHTEGSCSVTVFEVKAVDAPHSEYQIQDGIATGAAVEQVLSMRTLLSGVFASARENELIATPARREILREHAFRELTKARYSPEQRQQWVDVLERLFAGEIEPTIHLHLIEVQLGVDNESLGQPRVVQARDGQAMIPITISKLNEAGVEALQQPPDEQPPAGDEADWHPEGGPPDGDSSSPPEVSAEPAGGGADVPPQLTERAEPFVPAAEHQIGATEDIRQPSDDSGARPRVFLGTGPGAYGKPREIWFDPELPDQPLPNPHISITGETGSGKTQATKAILRELAPNGLPVLILDFKDDYSSTTYVESEKLNLYDASYGGLPFNPLIPPVDPRTRKSAPMNHVHQLSEILKRIYRLGDQQTFHLREAMKEVFEIQGVGLQPTVIAETQNYLPFDAVRDVLVRDGHDALLGRLSPIFDLGLFAAENDDAALDTLLGSPSVIRLSQLPADEVKNAVAEFLLLGLYNHLIRQPQPRGLKRLLVLDEAWRLVSSPFLEPLMREGRAFGLAVIVATQFPKDLPATVLGSTNTKLYFSQTQSDQIREIQRTIVGRTSGPEPEHLATTIRSMRPLSCLLQNAQYSPYVRVDVKPYYERV
jgi:hypothetical protein